MLVSTIELYWRASNGTELGLRGAETLSLDWKKIIERKDRIVQNWSKNKESSLSQLGIEVVRGTARFTGPHNIDVGDRLLTAEKIIIATGSKPARPNFSGAEAAITSDELIHLNKQPGKLVVIGGGFIGLEFGFALARAGTEVTILQSGPRVAPALDDEIHEQLLRIAQEANIEILTGAQVERVDKEKTVEARIAGHMRTFSADQILLATGRPSNVAGLDPASAGIELNGSAVKVNEFLQSASASHVYAVGDAAGKHQHSPVAWYEGPIAAHNALKGNEKKVDFSVFPSAVFTIPAIGQVGLTEREALDRGLKAKISRLPYEYNPAAGVRDETDGLVKIVYEEATDRILGVHIIGAHAEDIIQTAAVAIKAGMTKSDMGAMHYVFPTIGGALFDAMAAG